jgi:hypothetical protein
MNWKYCARQQHLDNMRQYVTIYWVALTKAMAFKASSYLSPYLNSVRQKYLESFEMLYCRRMQMISRTDRVKNTQVR